MPLGHGWTGEINRARIVEEAILLQLGRCQPSHVRKLDVHGVLFGMAWSRQLRPGAKIRYTQFLTAVQDNTTTLPFQTPWPSVLALPAIPDEARANPDSSCRRTRRKKAS